MNRREFLTSVGFSSAFALSESPRMTTCAVCGDLAWLPEDADRIDSVRDLQHPVTFCLKADSGQGYIHEGVDDE